MRTYQKCAVTIIYIRIFNNITRCVACCRLCAISVCALAPDMHNYFNIINTNMGGNNFDNDVRPPVRVTHTFVPICVMIIMRCYCSAFLPGRSNVSAHTGGYEYLRAWKYIFIKLRFVTSRVLTCGRRSEWKNPGTSV